VIQRQLQSISADMDPTRRVTVGDGAAVYSTLCTCLMLRVASVVVALLVVNRT
jgi:hypothetical protein